MLYAVFSDRGRRAALVTFFCGIFTALTSLSAFADSLTLAWDASTDPSVVGYNLYYGTASRTYTSMINVGNATSVTVSNLVPGTTYYFAATTYNAAGLESDYSGELVYTVPLSVTNQPPSLNLISNVTMNENAGLQTVNLTGISSGLTNQTTITITAISSNTGLIPNPTVNYTSPNTNGTLTFTPVVNGNGSATITVTVNNGASSNNTVSRSFTVTVNPVNQPPTLNSISNISVNENAGLQTVNLSGITSGATNENQTLTVTASSSNPSLIPNPTVNYTSPSANGTLSFTPAVNGNGVATISVTVNDGGASNNTVTRTFTVTVNSVNQAPTLNPISNVSINETAGLQTVSITGITSGAANENQTLTVTASSSNTGLIPNPAVNYTSPGTNGTLTFTPALNGNGVVTITVTVNDGGASNNIVTRSFTVTVNPVNQPPTLNPISNVSLNQNAGLQTINLSGITSGATNENQTLTVTASSGNTGLIPNPTVSYTSPNTNGTLTFTPVVNGNGVATISVTVNDGGASNNTVTRTFTVTVNSVNQAPTLDPIGNVSINENVGLQTVNLTGITSGATNENQTLTVTASSSNTGLIPNPAVTYTSPNTTGSLSFTPAVNGNGSAIITVTVNDGGVSNNTVSRTFTVTVNPVNQPPTLSPPPNISINENAGLQTVNLSGITSGATNENQTLTVTAFSSNTGLIPNPAVTYTSPNTTGTLSFTPTVNGNGSAIITVTVNDGGASNNTVTHTFAVIVNPVNQRPTLNPISNISINQNSGLQTVSLSGITSGATNEIQTLTVTASSGNTGLIPNPTVTYTSPNTTGSLSFTPIANGIGSATITVTVNDGGTSNNTVVQTFTVTVNPVNQSPTLNALNSLTILENSGLQTVNLSGISSGNTNQNQTLTVTASSDTPGLIPNPAVTYTSPNTTGTLTFTPVANQFGSASVTVTVNNGGASNNTISRSFTVTVDSPPTITGLTNLFIAVSNATPGLPFTIGDAETPASSLTLSVTSDNTALVPLNSVVFSGSSNSRFVTVTPVIGQTGVANIAVIVSDGFATATNSFQLTVQGKPAPPGNLHITIQGPGSVTPNLSSQSLTIGNTYTLTAVPAPSSEFTGWTLTDSSGTITSSTPTITFVLTSNLVLKAAFATNAFAASQTSYNGLFYQQDINTGADTILQNSSGSFTVTTTKKGRYTGRLQIGSVRYPFSGKFDSLGQGTNVLHRRGASDLTLGFYLVGDVAYGQVSDGGWTNDFIVADRATFNTRTNPAPFAGQYTVILPGHDSDPAVPAGDGFGAVRVTKSGIASVTGTLADGTHFSQSAPVSKDRNWPFYAPLYAGKGSVLSWLAFTNTATNDLNGYLSWIKPPVPNSPYYSGGFSTNCFAVGSTYIHNVSTNHLLNLESANVAFTGGNVSSSFTNSVTMLTTTVLNHTPNSLHMGLSLGNGLFHGTVIDPTSASFHSFYGAAFQKLNVGYGLLLGTDQSSRVTISE